MIENQAYLFIIFVINGVLIGLLFDFFRILRRSFKTNDFMTYVEDIIFWILTGLIILYSIFTFNNGEIRFFMFLAILLGIIIYMLSLSSYVIKINVKIIITIKNIIRKIFGILIFPIKTILVFIRKIFFKPISFVIINIKKILQNFLKKDIIKFKKSKNSKMKEGFLEKM